MGIGGKGKRGKNALKKSGGLYALVLAAVLLLQGFGAVDGLDNALTDSVYQSAGTVSPDICVIGIDEETLTKYGAYDTWIRSKTAELIELLSADPETAPAVIALDIGFFGSKNEQDDARLAAAAEKAGNVVLASTATFADVIQSTAGGFTTSTQAVLYETPYDALARAGVATGHTNLELDDDGFFRHAVTKIEYNSTAVYSLPYETYRVLTGSEPQLETNRDGTFYVDFAGEPAAFFGNVGAGSSLCRVLEGEYPVSAFAGKAVFFGAYASGMQDSYLTGIDRGMQMYGAEIHANILQAMLDGSYKTEPPVKTQLLVTLVFMLAAVLLFFLLDVKTAIPVNVGAAVLYVIAAYISYASFNRVLPMIYVPLGLVALSAVHLTIRYVEIRAEMQLAREKAMLIEKDMEFAKTIQLSAVPRVFPPFPEKSEFSLHALMDTAKEVGGDLYDYFLLGDDSLAFVIGDVSGKGVPAALFMMKAKYQIKMFITLKESLNEAFAEVNNNLCEENEAGMFVTAFGGILNFKTGELRYVNAGHNYPVIIGADGTCSWMKKKSGPPLAAMEDIPYKMHKLTLNKGDKLYLYTDGVTEAQNNEEELYGDSRLIELLERNGGLEVTALPDKVLEDVHLFAQGAAQADDITMLAIQYNATDSGE